MRTAAVIGTGLIGTSIALALTRRGVAVHLDDADTTAARAAEALGAGSLEAPRAPVDLAVIAVPPARIGAVLARCQREGLAHSYTDAASVKVRPHADLRAAGGDPAAYIGGHPLAGGERSGPLAARADLFEGRLWVLTPSSLTDRSALNRGLELVSLCGGVPVLMDTASHDRAVALTSHAPHLISALLAARLRDAEGEHVRVSGQGLRDVTRIAAGEPGLWGDILEANAEEVAEVLEAYAADLGRTITALRALRGAGAPERAAGAAALAEVLRCGNEGRSRVPHKQGGGPAVHIAVPVAIPDQPGALARLFSTVSDAGVNIEDVRIDHSVDRPSGLVELLVEQSSAGHVRAVLDANGWALAGTS
ncbi:prephenate dehydrogenase [Streptomyces sp. NBC_00536]|uniref:prephenate dehydrogenase n=1 Tax=Streptomyces sp. NBC_00536 TaxID=2975769 RepID=UPI002E80643E|nr:prephenate dehydrogenase [Streptomyces sp. NBC_00536]WUC79109.1 prephenate dehydrogenase [Streptomyces sp. NBC_00536]